MGQGTSFESSVRINLAEAGVERARCRCVLIPILQEAEQDSLRRTTAICLAYRPWQYLTAYPVVSPEHKNCQKHDLIPMEADTRPETLNATLSFPPPPPDPPIPTFPRIEQL